MVLTSPTPSGHGGSEDVPLPSLGTSSMETPFQVPICHYQGGGTDRGDNLGGVFIIRYLSNVKPAYWYMLLTAFSARQATDKG
jgi:hypothetical protein